MAHCQLFDTHHASSRIQTATAATMLHSCQIHSNELRAPIALHEYHAYHSVLHAFGIVLTGCQSEMTAGGLHSAGREVC